MRVSAVLKHKGREVVTVRPDVTVRAAVDLLRRHAVGAVVVSVDGRVIGGLLAERDVLNGLADHGPGFLERVVADVMVADPPCCHPDDSLEHLMGIMTRQRVRHLPVLVDGELQGIVSIGDVVERRLHELESERQLLHEYITLGR